MRGRLAPAVVVVLALVAACVGDGGDDAPVTECTYQGTVYPVGATWPAADGCNTCHCGAELGVECTIVACPDGDPALACMPSGACTTGQPCGSTCCGAGERCTYGACQCGTGDPCGPGDTCAAFGPGICGSICCGASGPCPQ